MRGAVISIVLAACSYNPGTAGGGGDDTPGEDTITIKHDTAADFADPAALDDAVIAPEGRIEPNAYVTGGLRARSYAGKLVDGSSTFATVDTAIAALTPRGRGYNFVPDDYQGARPGGLSIVDNDNYTIYFDGELFLKQGHPAVSIDGDDAAIMELIVDGTTHFLNDATGGRKQVDFDVAADGWYPIRLVMGEGGGNAKMSLQVNGILDRMTLRSRVTDERGLMATLYDPGHVNLRNTTAVDSFDGMFLKVSPPYDFAPTTTAGNYDFRMVGQVLLDVSGPWTFEIAPDAADTAKLWIDEKHVASKWADGVIDGLPAQFTLDLEAGWHDIFVDFRALQVFTNGTVQSHDASVALRATPPGGVAGPIPLDHLRPVPSSGLVTAVVQTNTNLAFDGVTTIPFQFPAAMTTIASVEAGYALSFGNRADYLVELDMAGPVVEIPDATGLDTFGLLFDETSKLGEPSPSNWSIKFTDTTQNGSAGNAGVAFIDIVTRGGPALPFSPVISYTSKPIATQGALRLGEVRVTGSFDAAEVVTEVRTAASEAELDAATFVELSADGIPEVDAGEVLQYRITAKSDGWQFPVIDAIELDYVVAE